MQSQCNERLTRIRKWERIKMKQKTEYVLDLTKITGNGQFLCPYCGNVISPDDTSEENYSILEAKVDSYGLSGLEIRCNKCESEIQLIGFTLLQELSKKNH